MSTRRLVHKSFQYLPEIGLAGSKEIPNMTYPTRVMLVGCKSRKNMLFVLYRHRLKDEIPTSYCFNILLLSKAITSAIPRWSSYGVTLLPSKKKRIRVHPLPSLPSQEVANKSKALLICFPWQTNRVIPVSSHSMKFWQYHKNATNILEIQGNHCGTYTD